MRRARRVRSYRIVFAMRRMRMKFTIVLLNFVFASNMLAQSKPTADLIITHAKVWTVDKAHPTGAGGRGVLEIESSRSARTPRSRLLRGTENPGDRCGRQAASSRFQRCPRALRRVAVCNSIPCNSTMSPVLMNSSAASPSRRRKLPRANGYRGAIGMRPNGVRPKSAHQRVDRSGNA